jgi:hypothetical protein
VAGFRFGGRERWRGKRRRSAQLLSSKKTKSYCELGKLLDALARSRDVRGSYNIAEHLNDLTNYEVSGQSVSKYLFGNNQPKRAFIVAFADAFELTEQERAALAWVYAYGSPMPSYRSEEALLSS